MDLDSSDVKDHLSDSIAFSTVNDLVLLKRVSYDTHHFLHLKMYRQVYSSIHSFKISEKDGLHMKECFRKYHESMASVTRKDGAIMKRSANLTNEILSERIALEKVRIEEADEMAKLRKMEEDRDNIQKETELAEQRDTLIKFELSELKRSHEDLKKALVNMNTENTSIVEPVFEKLRREVRLHHIEVLR